MIPLFRPEDRVIPFADSAQDARAAGFSSLPGIPCGEPWPRVAIREHRRSLEAAGVGWRVAELAVHEDIKAGRGDLLRASAYFRMTLRRLANVGVGTVIYDFTPVSAAIRGTFSPEGLHAALARYQGVGPAELAANLQRFLEAVIITATALGMGLALRPDDPSLPTLGLPRIASTEDQLAAIFSAVNLPANGLCLDAVLFGPRTDSELAALARRVAPRIHAARLPGGAHPATTRVLLDEQARRRAEGRGDWRLPVSPPLDADEPAVPVRASGTVRELSPSYAG